MFNRTTPRYFIIGIVLLWVVYSLMPTIQYARLSDEEKDTLRLEGKLAELEQKTINLGLDLQGGIHLVLEVDIPTLVKTVAENKTDALEEFINATADEALANEADFFDILQIKATNENFRLIRHFSMYGTRIDDIIAGLRTEADDAVDRSLEIIRNRVDQFGVSEPTIQKAGGRRIIVELAGVDNPAQARSLIENTALLEFNLVQDLESARVVMLAMDRALLAGNKSVPSTVSSPADAATPATTRDEGLSAVLGSTSNSVATVVDPTDAFAVPQEVLAEHPFTAYISGTGNNFVVASRYKYLVETLLASEEVKSVMPPDGIFIWGSSAKPLPGEPSGQPFYTLYYLYKEPGLTGGVITAAKANLGQLGSNSSGQPVVNVTMNDEGTRIWSRLTGANISRRIAIVLDKRVHMAPVINSKIPNGQTVIEGLDSIDEAKMIAIVLRAGSLPAPVDIIEERSVGPSLGQDSIDKGVNAAMMGGIFVILFMVVYYKGAGLIATFALIVNILVVLAALAVLRATLTLPGIAGLILTVGMAVDANVLIFERIKEELARGRDNKAAIESGYARATVTIIDANVTTILAAIVLFQFGTGPIKGFAVTLFWGITASMFTAIFMTRTIFMALSNRSSTKPLSI